MGPKNHVLDGVETPRKWANSGVVQLIA